MAIRTTRSTLTFRAPFHLDGADTPLPAGTYEVETDEEIIELIDRTVYRRIATMLFVRQGGTTKSISVDPVALDAAWAEDGRTT